MPMHGLPQGVENPPRPLEASSEDVSEGPIRPVGTLILVFVFLGAFVLYYFVNWKLLSLVWKIG